MHACIETSILSLHTRFQNKLKNTENIAHIVLKIKKQNYNAAIKHDCINHL